MSLRKEIRSFMRETRDWMKAFSAGKSVYENIIASQQKMIESLNDKLLARNLPELKTYTIPDYEPTPKDFDPADDEELVGQVAELD